jgi:hypothetical protein
MGRHTSALPLALVVLDASGTIIDCNDRLLKLLVGYGEHERSEACVGDASPDLRASTNGSTSNRRSTSADWPRPRRSAVDNSRPWPTLIL